MKEQQHKSMLNTLSKNRSKNSVKPGSNYKTNLFKRELVSNNENPISHIAISSEVLKSLLNQTTDLITVLDSDGNILYVSDSVEKILGFNKNDRIGQNALMMIHKDDLPGVYDDFLSILTSGKSTAVSSFRYLKADGSYVYLEASGSLVHHQNNKYIVIISRDITPRLEYENNIKRLSAAVEQSSNTVVITDIDGKIEYVNKKFADLTGFSKSEVIGETPAVLRSDDTKDETYKELWSTILTGNVWQGTIKNKKKSGEYYWERIKITPVVDDYDRITNFIALKDDITYEKKMNEELNTSLKEKELMLKEKEMLLKEKEIMLKEIHHRVKNNLQIVISLLNLQAASVDDLKLKNQLTISQNRVRSMALIHQHLYKSNDLTKINMDEYLISLCTQLLSTYEEIKDRVKIKVNAENIFFCIESAVPFGLLVNELVTNSLKHGFPGTMKGNVTIKLSRLSNNEFILEYSDSGIGIPMNLINGHVVSFGMSLIEMLVSQLEGKLNLNNNSGTNYKINFRGSNYQSRL